MEHIGELVRAHLLDTVNDTYYKFRARIETGHEAGREGYVAYKGDPSSISGNILVRLQYPSKRSNLEFKDSDATSHFVTSSIPSDFEFSSSVDTILYGIWEERMKQGFSVPIVGKIANYYNPGVMTRVLYYSNVDGSITPYDILNKHQPELLEHEDTGGTIGTRGTRGTRGVMGALTRYLTRIGKDDNPSYPRLVLVDEDIDLERIILPVFDRVIKFPDYSIVRHIQMEPQQ